MASAGSSESLGPVSMSSLLLQTIRKGLPTTWMFKAREKRRGRSKWRTRGSGRNPFLRSVPAARAGRIGAVDPAVVQLGREVRPGTGKGRRMRFVGMLPDHGILRRDAALTVDSVWLDMPRIWFGNISLRLVGVASPQILGRCCILGNSHDSDSKT